MGGCALVALMLAVLSAPAWCACPRDPVPPGVPQFIDEIGARPLQFVVGAVRFTNVNQATVEERQQIATQVEGLCFLDGGSEDVTKAIVEAFQGRGFFRAQVDYLQLGILDKDAKPPTVSVAAYVQEGSRYRLKGIEFAGNKAIANISLLRAQFKMNDGDVFRFEDVREGIKALRNLYAALGYINFTPVPDTKVDDKDHAIVLRLDLDEGKQFFVRSFTISGAEPRREAALLAAWKLPPGKVYNGNLVDLFFLTAKDLLPDGATPEHNLDLRLDQDRATVDITLYVDARP